MALVACNGTSPTLEPSIPTDAELSETAMLDAPSGAVVQWSEATWKAKKPPAPSNDLIVAAGQRLILNRDVTLKNITVYGTLEFANQDLNLSAASIMVESGGTFQIGSAINPYTKKAVVTLTGSNPNVDRMGMGTKFLGAMGGTISLHGKQNIRAWSKLSQTAAQGATTIQVLENTGWAVGDQIVVASGSHEPNEAEVGTIIAINGLGLTLSKPLKNAHNAKVVSLAGQELDMRPEVGLLSRNIVIQGDASSSSGFGGHLMIMAGSKAFIDGIELRNMGQKNRLGRYPFHWHLVGDAAGQYIKNSVVNGSLQRGIVIHGTKNARVENNIVYNSVGHNYAVEESSSIGNVLDGNLAISNQIVALTEATLKSQNDNQAANFWIRAAKNTFTNNVAAGSNSFGFWYDGTTDVATTFRQNTAHSVMVRSINADFLRGAGLTVENDAIIELPNGQERPVSTPLEFSDSFFYHNQTGIWPKDGFQTYRNIKLWDQSAHDVVGEGGEFTFTDVILVGNSSQANAFSQPAFHFQYSGAVKLEHPTFVNYGNNNVFSTNDIFMPWFADFTVRNPEFINTSAKEQLLSDMSVVELQDSLLAPKGFYVSNPQLAGPNAQLTRLGQTEAANYWRTEQRYHPAGLTVRQGLNGTWTAPGFIVRSDGMRYQETNAPAFQVLFDAGYSYRLESVPSSEYILHLTFVGDLPASPSGLIVATPANQAPTAVYRLGEMTDGGSPPDPPTENDRLSPASSLAEFQASPQTKYYYDSSAKLLYNQINKRWLMVRP